MQYVQGKCIQRHAACILTEIPTATVWERNREVRVMQLLLCLLCFLIHAVCSSLTSGLSLTTILTVFHPVLLCERPGHDHTEKAQYFSGTVF